MVFDGFVAKGLRDKLDLSISRRQCLKDSFKFVVVPVRVSGQLCLSDYFFSSGCRGVVSTDCVESVYERRVRLGYDVDSLPSVDDL